VGCDREIQSCAHRAGSLLHIKVSRLDGGTSSDGAGTKTDHALARSVLTRARDGQRPPAAALEM